MIWTSVPAERSLGVTAAVGVGALSCRGVVSSGPNSFQRLQAASAQTMNLSGDWIRIGIPAALVRCGHCELGMDHLRPGSAFWGPVVTADLPAARLASPSLLMTARIRAAPSDSRHSRRLERQSRVLRARPARPATPPAIGPHPRAGSYHRQSRLRSSRLWPGTRHRLLAAADRPYRRRHRASHRCAPTILPAALGNEDLVFDSRRAPAH